METTDRPDAPANPTGARPVLGVEDVRRIAARYPRRALGGPFGWALLIVLAAVFLGWVVWAGLGQATPDVAAQVSSFSASSDSLVRVSVDVQRADTSSPAVCTLTAVGTNGISVGELDIRVPAGGSTMTTVTTDVRTTDHALSANVTNCRIP